MDELITKRIAKGDKDIIERLVRKVADGDRNAFDQLITPFRGLIRSIAWDYFHNREDVEDCENEAMARVWQGLDRNMFRYNDSFKAFVSKVTANTAINMLRMKKRQGADITESLDGKTMDKDGEIPFEAEDPSVNVEEIIEKKTRKEELRRALGEIPPDQSYAIVLTQLEGKSYAEVAHMEGVAEGTIKSRVNRGIKSLTRLLNPPNVGENNETRSGKSK